MTRSARTLAATNALILLANLVRSGHRWLDILVQFTAPALVGTVLLAVYAVINGEEADARPADRLGCVQPLALSVSGAYRSGESRVRTAASGGSRSG